MLLKKIFFKSLSKTIWEKRTKKSNNNNNSNDKPKKFNFYNLCFIRRNKTIKLITICSNNTRKKREKNYY